jgi:hypothetical protein
MPRSPVRYFFVPTDWLASWSDCFGAVLFGAACSSTGGGAGGGGGGGGGGGELPPPKHMGLNLQDIFLLLFVERLQMPHNVGGSPVEPNLAISVGQLWEAVGKEALEIFQQLFPDVRYFQVVH